MTDIDELETQLKNAKANLQRSELQQEKQVLKLENMKDDNTKVKFYTGFASFSTFMVCFNFLGPSVSKLYYWTSGTSEVKSNKGRKRLLSPLNEFFLVLIRLRLGLCEQDLAYQFCISQSTVSRIINTWINFLYLQLKQIPIWAPNALVEANMPAVFKARYPSTRVIIDATEIYVEQPTLPELQQITFSNYKNKNTYKGLIGIPPSGAITFISDLYSGSISDKELTLRCGLLSLLEPGDSVMGDRGFDIKEDLDILGVKLNIPHFLRGKQQLD